MSTVILVIIVRHLSVYFGTGIGILWLSRRVAPISTRMCIFLLLVPLGLTARAVLSGGTYAPIDVSFQTDPLQSLRAGVGVGSPSRAVLGDVVYQDIPWRKAIRDAVQHGRLPTWNRFILGGEPLLAVMQSAVLHPFTWIGMLLPLDQAWTLEMTLGLFLALVSAFLLFADLPLSKSAAALGAIGWAFSDYLRFYAGWALSPAAAVFPLLLLGLRRVAMRRRLNGALIVIAALALCLVAGHPETALHAVCGGGIWFLVELWGTARGSRFRTVAGVLLAGLVATGVTAILLVPHLEALHQTWEYFFRSTWWVSQHKSSSLAESLSTIQQAFVPYALGVAGFGKTAVGSQVPQAYLGSILLPFAATGLFARRKEKWACVFLAIVGFGAWCHFPVLADVISSLPLLDLALNERLVFLGCFAVALLGAMGADVLLARPSLALWTIPATAALIILIYRSGLVRLRSLEMPGDFRTMLFLAQLIPLLLMAAVWAVWAVWALPLRRHGSAPVAVALFLLIGQRLIETWYMYPVAPREAFYPHLTVLDPIPRGAPYRMAALGLAFIPNVSTLYEVEDVRGYEAMTFLPLFETYPLWCVHQPVWFNRIDDPTRPFLSFLNMKYVLAAPGVPTPPGWPVLASSSGGQLVQNPNALERAFIPREVQVQPESGARLSAMAMIQDFGRQGLLNQFPGRASGAWLANGRGALRISEYRGDYLRLDIEAAEDLIVATSIPAWRGWIARLDDSPAPLLRYNHAFLGSSVPAGRHRLELHYLPASFLIGAWVSAGTILGLATLLAFEVRRRQEESRKASISPLTRARRPEPR